MGRAARAEDEPPSLARALYLEKTARDPAAALAVFRALAESGGLDPAARAEGRLGEARCLLALGRGEEAVEAWKRLEADADAPTAAKEEARARREEHVRARAAVAESEAEARAREAMRRAEEARVEREGRVAAAQRLVDSAAEHVRAKRYEQARESLLKALEIQPNDPRAAALLEEVGGYADRGELLRQAIRFVATNRVTDWRRLVAGVEALRREGLRLLREEKPDLAVRPLHEAVTRIDEGDFWSEMADTRRELVILLRKALDDAKSKGLKPPTDVDVPLDRPEAPPGPKAWRGEFFALLGRIFTSGADPSTGVRFLDAGIPPDPAPESRGGGFTASGIAAAPEPGTLRRARWIERHLREELAPGGWTGADRLLERYDDLVVVQSTPGVLRDVDALVGAFAQGPPPPTTAQVRVYAAEPGGTAEVVRLFEPKVGPADPPGVVLVRSRRLDEQDEWLARSGKLVLLAQATVRLTGRHATLVRFREPTEKSPWYAPGGLPPLRITDRDATYGLDLDLYAEDLPGRRGHAAVSVVATVRRPDRPRPVLTPNGLVRAPVFLTQTLEADRLVPHAGSLMLTGLANPFRATGAAGDAAGGTHPDLLVFVSATPADAAGAPDIPPPPPRAPAPAADGQETREYDLAALGTEVVDEPPPEDWPLSPYGDAARPAAARAQRDAFLAGLLADRAGVPAGAGGIVVKDGRATAVLPVAAHQRLAREVETLLRDEGRVFSIEVRAVEVPTERATPWLAEAGARGDDPAQRVWRLAPEAAARLEDRLRGVTDSGGLFTLDARLAARHTQLVTCRSLRSRSVVTEFRVESGADGRPRTVPVNGTTEEGILVGVRPLASVGGLAVLYVNAVLGRIERIDPWTPPDAPGEAPVVSLPRHRVERAGGAGAIGDRDTMLLVVPAPGASGERVVLIRARHVPAR